MAAETRVERGEKRKSSSTIKNARALRYDNLASVLIKVDEQVHGPAKYKGDRTPAADPTQLAELRAEVASVKAEHQRLVERLTGQLNRLAERLVELEAQAHRPWWARMLGASGQDPEPARRPRGQAVARLRALCEDRAAVEYRPT
jgi:hypothetical protein